LRATPSPTRVTHWCGPTTPATHPPLFPPLFHFVSVLIIDYIEYSEHARTAMSEPTKTTMTVRLNGDLSDFVAANVCSDGSYENISEYIRDLIRRDKQRVERQAFNRLEAELKRAFAATDATYHPVIVQQ
jgi:Arc/MetJ-type ribon-helix-helix transcriptional regulator